MISRQSQIHFIMNVLSAVVFSVTGLPLILLIWVFLLLLVSLGQVGVTQARWKLYCLFCEVLVKLIDIKSFLLHYGSEVDSASNGNEYREYFLGVKAASA